jgi:hypothetical protein
MHIAYTLWAVPGPAGDSLAVIDCAVIFVQFGNAENIPLDSQTTRPKLLSGTETQRTYI